MIKEIIVFGDIELENNKLYHHNSSIFLDDVYTGKALVSNKISSDEKNLSTLLVIYNNYKVKPLLASKQCFQKRTHI